MTPSSFGPIRAVYFDAVGTLIHTSPSAVATYHGIGQQFGSRLLPGAIAERFKAAFAEQVELDQQRGLVTSEEREVARWRTIVGQVLSDVERKEECFQTLYDHFARPDAWAVDPDAEETLAWLAERGFRLGLCSNFDRRLRGILAGMPQLSRLQDVVISSEVGFCKPAREFFALLPQRTGLPASQILVVGDDLNNDYWGARHAGLAALLLTSRDKKARRADDAVKRLLEVPAWFILKSPSKRWPE